jgi:hypothetical protein
MLGAPSYVNWSAATALLVPPTVATLTLTKPALSAGEVALQLVLLEQLSALAASVPNLAVVEPTTKPVPVMVTTSVPPVPPADRLMELMTGTAS